MLEDTRKKGANIAVYLVFGLLIVIFAISFGPQSFGQGQGCNQPTAQPQVTIAGKELGFNTWRWALNGTDYLASIYQMRQGAYPERASRAIDGLVRRELLALEAERRGLSISDSVVDDKIKEGEIYILTTPVPGKQIYFEDGEFFDYKALERLVVQLGLRIATFKAEQRRELLAQAMEQILSSGVRVSRDEVKAIWAHAARTVTFDVVAFDVAAYRDKLDYTDTDIDRWAAAHEAEVKAKYEAEKAQRFTGTLPQVRVRRVLVKKEDKAKLEAARAEIVAKKKTLADVAKALDTDDKVRGKAGDLGWKIADAPQLGDPALDTALEGLQPGGEPSAVVETADGAWLLAVEETRSGDLTYDQVKRELAETMAPDHWAREAARRAAVAALAEAKKTGGKLAELYPKAEEPPLTPGALPPEQQQELIEFMEQQLQRPDLTDEQRQMFEQQLEKLRRGELGLGTWETPDMPAAWQPADEPTGVGAAPAAAAPAPDLMTPSKETLPKLGTVEKPPVERMGPMPRDAEEIRGLGEAPELIAALFETLQVGQLADRIYAVESPAEGKGDVRSYVIVQLIEKAEPDPAEFEKQADLLVRTEQAERGRAVVSEWLMTRCEDLVAKKELEIATELLTMRDDKGEVQQFQYAACSGL